MTRTLLALALLPALAAADEGMWLPEQLPAVGPAWAERGLELDPGALADPMAEPLNAIVTLGFCSASFVSPDGLVVTNHHCVEGYLRQLSSGASNHHRDGFRATTRADEAWVGPGARVGVVERIEDVTRTVLAGLTDRTDDAQRHQRIEDRRKALVARCEQQPHRRCAVVPYFGGSTWRLLVFQEFEDVRMVYAPPMGVGQFGGEVDNWMWPRHGADFAFLRVYVGPDGQPAAHDEANVPYTPPHHLRVRTDDLDDGDFVMIAGFPGRTDRHGLARELAFQAEQTLPKRVAYDRAVEATLLRHAEADPEAAARLGASISRVANGRKFREGLLAGLATRDGLARKQAEEQGILDWIAADASRAQRLRPVYDAYARHVDEALAASRRRRQLANLRYAADLLYVAHDALRWAEERRLSDRKRERGYQDRDLDDRRARYERLDRSLWLPADRDVLRLAFEAYQTLPREDLAPAVDRWIADQGGLDAALDRLFDAPALAETEARLALLDASAKDLAVSTDPWVELARALEATLGPLREADEARSGARQRLESAWMTAKREWADDRGVALYDDANGTLRLTLGHVRGYAPQDGLFATPFTTLAGMVAKAGEAPFDVPAETLARAAQGPKHRLIDPDLGDVPVDFLSTLDITGGNSGSAILDGRGDLVGLAFDGNWESVLSDEVFEAEVNRCIGVDVRYVQWVLEGDPAGQRVLGELVRAGE